MTARSAVSSRDFPATVTTHGLGYNLPQKMGARLWGPMWLLAMVAFPVAFVIGLVRSNSIADGGNPETALSLLHVQAGIMFIGFAGVFAAISFAVARILGEFRRGGGEIQEAVGGDVVTLKTPVTAKILVVGMMMAMLAIVIASIIHFVWAGQVSSGAVSLASGEEAFVILEAVRRIGVALYLVSITSGLATIVTVLRFQAIRLREVAGISS